MTKTISINKKQIAMISELSAREVTALAIALGVIPSGTRTQLKEKVMEVVNQ